MEKVQLINEELRKLSEYESNTIINNKSNASIKHRFSIGNSTDIETIYKDEISKY